MSSAQDIVVAGAGAVGGTIAYVLARAGHRVVVADPAALGDNASGIAAGMLAPAFETLFDETTAGGFELLAAARDLGPELASSLGIRLIRDGALAVGGRDEVEAWATRLAGFGARRQVLAPSEAAQLAPGLKAGAWAVFSPEDWRLEPIGALRRLRAAAEEVGARFIDGRAIGFANGRVEIEGAAALPADTLVVATGAGRDLAALAPELTRLAPVKGHILRADLGWATGPTLRAAGVYLCPGAEGLILGATMEAGRDDANIDAGVVAGLVARAETLAPGMARLDWRAATGVRAATPDGLPMVGPSRTPGVVLAVGARRNGWLLAPIIARAVLATVEGGPPAGPATLFEPGRFEPSQPG